MAGRSNREILTGGKKYQQKQSKKFGVEEVVFDPKNREEYLTGFHKRKVERQKKAQVYNKEQDRLAKIEERKKAREERQRDFEEQIKNLNETKNFLIDNEMEESSRKSAKKKLNSTENGSTENGNTENGTWEGFSEDEEDSDSEPVRGILQRKQVYRIDNPEALGDAVVDEETTVTVEALENPYAAKFEQTGLEAMAKANFVDLKKSDEVLEKAISRAKNYAVVCGVSKPKPKAVKKKKFRYLTKTERQQNNRKIKLSKMKSRSKE